MSTPPDTVIYTWKINVNTWKMNAITWKMNSITWNMNTNTWNMNPLCQERMPEPGRYMYTLGR